MYFLSLGVKGLSKVYSHNVVTAREVTLTKATFRCVCHHIGRSATPHTDLPILSMSSRMFLNSFSVIFILAVSLQLSSMLCASSRMTTCPFRLMFSWGSLATQLDQSLTLVYYLCISQFQLRAAPLPHPLLLPQAYAIASNACLRVNTTGDYKIH